MEYRSSYFHTFSEEFIPTLEDVSSMTQISLLGYTNAIEVELSEDDHAKMKFLTMWMMVLRSLRNSIYISWLRYFDDGKSSRSNCMVEAFFAY